MISSCDKNVPAHLIAAARLDIPVIFVTGGPMSSGGSCGGNVTIANLDAECYMYGIGEPRISETELSKIENASCPGAGSCAILGTANTMQCLVEALGLALPGSGTAPAVSAQRLWIAKETGRRIVGLVNEGVRASHILTQKALRNAIKTLHALGGSSNAIAHILAIAYENHWEKEINLDLIERFSDQVPCITNVTPSGTYSMQDFHGAGGVQAVLKSIEAHIETDAMTVSGRTIGEQLADYRFTASDIIRETTKPTAKNGLVILRGNLAASAIVRTPVIPKEMLKHEGPARVFNSQEDALLALKDHKIHAGDVLVLRYEGPRGGPGFNEVFKVIGLLNALGLETKCALVTDGRISGFAKGPYICQVAPEAAVGGPLAMVKEGDIIRIDIPKRKLDFVVSDEELALRQKSWKAPEPRVREGILTVYARLANSAEFGGGINMRL